MTGSLYIKNNEYYVILNMVDGRGKRVKQPWINTTLKERGNKKRAEALLTSICNLSEGNIEEEFIKIIRKEIKKQGPDAVIANLNEDYGNYLRTNHILVLRPDSSGEHYEDGDFLDWVQIWMDYKSDEGDVDATVMAYESITRVHLKPYFTKLGKKISELTSEDIRNYFKFKRKESKLSENTLAKHYVVIRGTLAYAVKKKVIFENVTDEVQKPQTIPYSANYYSLPELKKLLQTVAGNKLETVVYLCSFFGLRRSEALGLKWDAVDFNANMITIRNKVTQIKGCDGRRQVKASSKLKTKRSSRSLPMSLSVRQYLLRLKRIQKENKKFFGKGYDYTWDGYVCVNVDGTLICPDYVNSMFPKFLKKHHLRKIRFHDLRHTCATLLLRAGFNMRQLQEWLGHSDFGITAKIYAHVDYEDKATMADSLEHQINGGVLGENSEGRKKEALRQCALDLLKQGETLETVKEWLHLEEDDIYDNVATEDFTMMCKTIEEGITEDTLNDLLSA
ncbi:tyrosine-type recombinase/integrase [Christensenella tenuis]|uniref:Site-specific integrase n=1 Tax=Christensenella tenuis TaxID=2763033 RepID=A0ABR7EEE2_9FIRM|nr:site-specific integrase [Christensenella tenuis]MBC5648121.1 site-specific integrase [Christensenella tenuis]